MTDLTEQIVLDAVSQFQDPYLQSDYVSADAIKSIDLKSSEIRLCIELGYPMAGVKEELQQTLQQHLASLIPDSNVQVEISQKIASHVAQRSMETLAEVKNIIAIASGKGGVGKSTTAVNLALALAADGATVGILDADIYGPSQCIMLGIDEDFRPEVKDEKFFLPAISHGIQAMSMGFLTNDKTPIVWRGPMVSGALQQMLNQTLWRDLDYLIVDLPPGTGDIQLTLSQRVPVSGALIVTTPQDIALLDATKAIEMFRKVEIPVLGVVENMSQHICSQCGHIEPIFGEGGGEAIADDYQVPLLGQLPLEIAIREQSDSGTPIVAANADEPIALIYRDIARKMAALLSKRARSQAQAFPNIVIKED